MALKCYSADAHSLELGFYALESLVMVFYFDFVFTSPKPGQLRILEVLVVELTQLDIIFTAIQWCTSSSVDDTDLCTEL